MRKKNQPLLFTTTRSQVPFELQALINQLISSRVVSEGTVDASVLDNVLQAVPRLLTRPASHDQALSQMRKVLKRQEYSAEGIKNKHQFSSSGSSGEPELNQDDSYALNSQCDLDIEVDFDSLFASTDSVDLVSNQLDSLSV
jgi:hypothetical protein